jgi:hypothetical protein
MALPDWTYPAAGTAKVWKASGGDYALTLTSLADAAAREGAKGDFNDGTMGPIPEYLDILFELKMAVAAANGAVIELWAGQSDNATAATNNPGGLTGADAAVSTPAEKKLQLDPIGAFALSNNLGTGTQKQKFRFYPSSRYFIPVIVNRGGQAFSSTAGDHILTITPYFRTIAE